MRTPQRAPLVVASAALAEAIAAEWRAQGETIDPATMPMTGLTNAAIDLAAPAPATFAHAIAASAATALFCYRRLRASAQPARPPAEGEQFLTPAEARYGVGCAVQP